MSPGAGNSRKEALDYLHAMLGQLHAMAETERLDMLSYLIEMAYIEASDALRRERAFAHTSADDDRVA